MRKSYTIAFGDTVYPSIRYAAKASGIRRTTLQTRINKESSLSNADIFTIEIGNQSFKVQVFS